MLKLLVVEDHALVREGLVQTLRQLAEDVVVHTASDCDSARVSLLQHEHIDLILLDLGLPGVDGLSCLKMLRQRHAAIPVVILSAYDDALTVGKAMKAGAASFVPKTFSGERLLAALRDVLEGRAFSPASLPVARATIPPHVARRKEFDPADFGLTERQTEVLNLMVSGKSNRDIGALLGLSEGTVKIHLTAIYKSLGVSSRTQAVLAINARAPRGKR